MAQAPQGTPYLIGTANAAAGSTTLAVNVTVATGIGDTIVVCFEADSVNGSSVTDTQGNSYTQRRAGTAGVNEVYVYTADITGNPAGVLALTAFDTITVTWAAATSPKLVAAVGVNGLATAVPLDVSTGTNGTSASPSRATGALAQAQEVVIAAESNANAGGAVTWAGGWTQLASVNQAGTSAYLSVAYNVVASTASVTASGTLSSSVTWEMQVISFRLFIPVLATMPQIQVLAGFGFPGQVPPTGSMTDISAFVRSGQTQRNGTRLAGPLWQYQAGTLTLVLKNGDGRFDPDNLTGPYAVTTNTVTQVFTKSGTWQAPLNLSGTTIDCKAWGGGGGGANGGGTAGQVTGGGGGEFAQARALAVTPGTVYNITVGAFGAAGAGAYGTNNPGAAGGNSSMAGDSNTVTAHGGGGGTFTGAANGGTGSTNTVHHNGGSGGTGAAGSAGAGGGSSAGPFNAGNPGGNATSSTGGAGGTAVTSGGAGGAGGDLTHAGTPGQAPGGGGGAGGVNTASGYNRFGGSGAPGQVILTYQVTTAATLVTPGVPVQVTATWNGTGYPVFTGFADTWQDNGANIPSYAEVTLTATDAFEPLSLAVLAPQGSAQGAGLATGDLINLILAAAGWPAAMANIDEGLTITQGSSYGSDALSLIQTAADTEAGSLFVTAYGNVRFVNRQGPLNNASSTTPQGVFGDSPGTVHAAGTELPYFQPQRADDNTTLFNDVQNTRAGGILQEATDSVGAALYFLRSYQRGDLLQNTDTDALSWAQFVLYIADTVEDRIDQLTITPQRDTADLWPQALARDITDRIQIWRRPPGVAAFSKDCYIRGVQHTWDEQSWQTAWTTQSADKYGSFWTLNDPVLGRLNYNALCW